MFSVLCTNRPSIILTSLSSHLSHHLFAAWAFGASPELLQEIYDLHAKEQRPALTPPSEITESNWKEHLGDEQLVFNFNGFLARTN